MHVIGFILFGLIVGLLARALYPQSRRLGWLATAIIGMSGSLIGAGVEHALSGGLSWGFTPRGWVASFLGAGLLLWAWFSLGGRAHAS